MLFLTKISQLYWLFREVFFLYLIENMKVKYMSFILTCSSFRQLIKFFSNKLKIISYMKYIYNLRLTSRRSLMYHTKISLRSFFFVIIENMKVKYMLT